MYLIQKKSKLEDHDQCVSVREAALGNLPMVAHEVHEKWSFESCKPAFWCLSGHRAGRSCCWQLNRGNGSKGAASVRFSTCVRKGELFPSCQAKARVTGNSKFKKNTEKMINMNNFFLSSMLGQGLRNVYEDIRQREYQVEAVVIVMEDASGDPDV